MNDDWSDPLEKAGRRDIGELVWTSPLWWCNYYQSPYAGHLGRGSNIISSEAPGNFADSY